MLVVSYDIKDDKLRTKFLKMLTKNGAVRLQYSVYEINNTERVMNNLMVIIEMNMYRNLTEVIASLFLMCQPLN